MQKIFDYAVKSGQTLRVVVMEVENDSTTVENQVETQQSQVVCPFLSPKSGIRLKKDRGIKVNFLRFVYALFVLGFFETSDGSKLTKKKVFQVFGQALNENFSAYSNDLSQSKRVNTQMDTQTSIFRKMEKVIRDHFDIF